MGLTVISALAPNTVEAVQNGGNVPAGVVKDVAETVSVPAQVASTVNDTANAAADEANKVTNQARANWTQQQVQQTKSGVPALDKENEDLIRSIRPAWNTGQ